MKYFLFAYLLVVAGVLAIMGFRGEISRKPPLRLFPDMDDQSKYKPQGTSEFFADGRTDRLPVTGADARGELKDDPFFHFGKESLDSESWSTGFPMEVTVELIDHGQKKYAIYCIACHGGTGDGNGVTKFRGMTIISTYHDDRLRNMPEGEIFNTVTNGIRLMGSYKDKLSEYDRWAVIAYMRVLQRAQNARAEDVPEANRGELGL